jgi:hypothetical protein
VPGGEGRRGELSVLGSCTITLFFSNVRKRMGAQ